MQSTRRSTGSPHACPRRACPPLTRQQSDALARAYERVPEPSANDGIVPTRSQVWGDVIHAARADHHDVIGHFGDPAHVPPHFDWLATGTGFGRADFEALWTHVARFVATGAVAGAGARRRASPPGYGSR